MQAIRKWAPLFAIALVAINSGALRAEPPVTYQPLPQEQLTPVEVAATTLPLVRIGTDEAPRISTPTPTPTPRATPRPRPRATPRATPRPFVASGSSVKGKASWYCKAGVSVCHYAHPPGSMVAAACTALREAMGPGWRGQFVLVRSGGRSIVVQLVDWCASTDKLIDLYWEPMRRLGGTGVLPVTVRW